MLAHLVAAAPDALMADMRRVYGLNLTDLAPLEAAALARWLPDGAMVWRVLDLPNAWTTGQHLLACLVDQLQMWMWAQADKRKRGPKPKPLPRPGQQKQETKSDTAAMSVEELDAFMSRTFTDITQ